MILPVCRNKASLKGSKLYQHHESQIYRKMCRMWRCHKGRQRDPKEFQRPMGSQSML